MMEMSAELTAAVLENILRHGKFNIPTRNAMENAVRIMKETPEVVRCIECQYWQDYNGGYPNDGCKWRDDETPEPDDYCSAGERLKDS